MGLNSNLKIPTLDFKQQNTDFSEMEEENEATKDFNIQCEVELHQPDDLKTFAQFNNLLSLGIPNEKSKFFQISVSSATETMPPTTRIEEKETEED